MPACAAFTVQVKIAWCGSVPTVGPVCELHNVDRPFSVQAMVPPGAAAPVMPVTVAVKVIVPPNTGLTTGTDTAIVGVAAVTTIDAGAVGASAVKMVSPPYVAVAV